MMIILIIILMITVAFFFTTGGVALLLKGKRVRDTFATVSGTVIDVRDEFNSMRDRREIKQTVEYEVNGVRYVTNNMVPKGKPMVGDNVIVTYNKEKPEEVRDSVIYQIFGTVLTTLGIILAIAVIAVFYTVFILRRNV